MLGFPDVCDTASVTVTYILKNTVLRSGLLYVNEQADMKFGLYDILVNIQPG